MSDQCHFSLRPYERTDAAAVVELVNAAAGQTGGLTGAVVDGVGNVRLRRYVPADSDKVVALDRAGALVGYAYLSSAERHIAHETGGAVHPRAWGCGVGTLLVEWAARRAEQRSLAAPEGVRTVLQVNLREDERPAIDLFSELGFAPVREWCHMQIELAAPPAPPAPPAPLRIRPMDLDNDWELAGPAMDDAYADLWGALPPDSADAAQGEEADDEEDDEGPPTDDSYSNAPGHCFLALDGDTAVGGVLCNARLVERSDSGRVGSLFVRRAYRRRGVGRALMLAAFGSFWQRGVRRIILDTDAHSFTDAPRFYRGLGMRPYRREFLYERALRPGRELRLLAPA